MGCGMLCDVIHTCHAHSPGSATPSRFVSKPFLPQFDILTGLPLMRGDEAAAIDEQMISDNRSSDVDDEMGDDEDLRASSISVAADAARKS